MKLRELITAMREREGVSLTALSKKINGIVLTAKLRSVEEGRTTTSLDKFDLIAEVLGYEVTVTKKEPNVKS